MNMDILHTRILALCQVSHPTILLGLSGGPDSVFLFHVLQKLHDNGAIKLICAHLDHEWRKDSGDDVVFCQQLCEKHDIQFISAKASKLPVTIKYNGSKEEHGRKLRRFFLEDTATKTNATVIALAHHLDDQQETFFWRIIRGASLAGLTGMKDKEGLYIRPLLDVSKKDILASLDTISYRTDSSNDDPAYLRNRIRKSVLPALRTCDARFDQKFASTLSHLQDTEAYLTKITSEQYEHIFDDNHRGERETFVALDSFMQKRLLLRFLINNNASFSPSNAYLDEICSFLQSSRGGAHQLGPSWQLVKKQGTFWIESPTQ